LSFSFQHGEQALIGLLLAGIVVIVGGSVVFYIWLRRTKLSAVNSQARLIRAFDGSNLQ